MQFAESKLFLKDHENTVYYKVKICKIFITLKC